MSNEVLPGTEAADIIAEEERLHGRVQARVAMGEEEEQVERVSVDEYDRELIVLRDLIAEAKPEDLAPLVEQMTRLAAIRGRLGGSRSLPVDIQSPYFAHMVLHEDGRSRDVLIGKRGFIDRKNNVQIVDWRNAPVSRIYYRYEEGDDYDEEIAGRRLEGVVEVRRNISIFGGKLRRIGAPQGTFIRDARNVWHQAVGLAAPTLRGGQGKAVRVPRVPMSGGGMQRQQRGKLGVHHGGLHRADKALPEIAALIDREQFDLITQPESGMVIIQGGAGSGKTTVALHRIAYLNFADRNRFRPTAMLFVVPSPSLVKYVAGVLPALGVSGVPVMTYESWARNVRQQLLPGSSGKYNQDTPEAVSRVKKHPALLGVLENYVAEQVAEAEIELLRAVGPQAQGAVKDEWRRLATEPLVMRLSRLGRWAQSANLSTQARVAVDTVVKRWRRLAADVLADWSEIMTDRERLWAEFSAAEDVSRADIESTVAWCARQLASGPDGEEQDAAGEQPVDPDGNVIAAVDGEAVVESEGGDHFDMEDDPILLRLVQLKRGTLMGPDGKEIAYEHVAIDEAQDRSAIEVKVLIEATRMVPEAPGQRSITIAGDTAQRLVFDNHFTGWKELLESTGQVAVVRPLKLSYRSTAEVMEFAREVLGPELAPEEPLMARPGEPVELHEFGDIGEAVAFLADALRNLVAREPTASVAVIARHPEQADAYFQGFKRAEVPSLRRVRNHEFSFAAGIDVTDVTQVKGLEFDYVIMVEVNLASYPATVESRHLLHIGATRAAHQLWLVATAEPSPLLPARMRDAAMVSGLAVSSDSTAGPAGSQER